MRRGSVALGYIYGGTGTLSHQFVTGLRELMLWDRNHKRRLDRDRDSLYWIATHCGSGDLVAGRNKTARVFLDKTDCEWLFVIDTDMGFPGSVIDDLLAHADRDKRPIVGALCFQLKQAGSGDLGEPIHMVMPTMYRYKEDEAGFVNDVNYPPDDCVEVDATGSACILIHRSVFEKIRERDGDHWYTQFIHPKLESALSEDFSFCLRADSLGFPIHVATGVKTNHDKGGLQANEEYFERQMRAVEGDLWSFFAGMTRLVAEVDKWVLST